MMIVFHFLQSWGYYGFGTLVPLVLAARGYDVVTGLGYLGVIFIGYPIGSALSLPIIERTERKHLIIGSAVAMSVFGLIFGASGSEAAILILGFCYTATSNIFSNAFHVYQAEIFPTRLRGTASAGTYSISRLSSGLLPFILVPILHHFGSTWMFVAVAVAMVIAALDIVVGGPHTTGRTLTEVNTTEPRDSGDATEVAEGTSNSA